MGGSEERKEENGERARAKEVGKPKVEKYRGEASIRDDMRASDSGDERVEARGSLPPVSHLPYSRGENRRERASTAGRR